MGSIDKACISGFLCRLCSEMHRIVIHIYGDQGQRLCLVEKINGYLPITISPTDPLPKTICTTCLRRVEQHYDLLMRLSRIKEERFLRVNKQRPRVSPVSSIENSEEELYQSEDESRRLQHTQDASQRQISESQQRSYISAPTPSSSAFAVSEGNDLIDNGQMDNNLDHNDGYNSGASTSANALAAISENVAVLNDSSRSTSSSSINTSSVEGGHSPGIALQQHSN